MKTYRSGRRTCGFRATVCRRQDGGAVGRDALRHAPRGLRGAPDAAVRPNGSCDRLPFAGQHHLENTALVAHCVSTVPLRARLDPDSLSRTTFARRRRSARAQEHSPAPSALVRRLDVPRDPEPHAARSIMFALDKVGAPFDFGEVSILSVGAPKSYCNFELSHPGGQRVGHRRRVRRTTPIIRRALGPPMVVALRNPARGDRRATRQPHRGPAAPRRG